MQDYRIKKWNSQKRRKNSHLGLQPSCFQFIPRTPSLPAFFNHILCQQLIDDPHKFFRCILIETKVVFVAIRM